MYTTHVYSLFNSVKHKHIYVPQMSLVWRLEIKGGNYLELEYITKGHIAMQTILFKFKFFRIF